MFGKSPLQDLNGSYFERVALFVNAPPKVTLSLSPDGAYMGDNRINHQMRNKRTEIDIYFISYFAVGAWMWLRSCLSPMRSQW